MEKTLQNAIQRYFKIQTKDGQLIDFQFNEAQRRFYEQFKKDYGNKPPRYIVLKARQLGISTFTEALITALTLKSAHSHSVIVAHESKAATNIYAMAKRYVDNLPNEIRPEQKYSNAKELVFDNDTNTGLGSSINVLTVGEGARGSTYRFVHLSELGFWKDAEKAMLAIMQTVSDDNKSLVVIESTANGMNFLYTLWQDASQGKNDFTPLFFPWYIEPTYSRKYTGFTLNGYEKEIQQKYGLTLDQLEWRRYTIANKCNGSEMQFRQEYPISPEEAFIVSGKTVFDTEKVLDRMKKVPTPIRQGYFKYDYDGLRITNIKFVDSKDGLIKIFKEPDNDITALALDTAGTGEDFFAAHVLDRDANHLAVLHRQDDEDLCVKQAYCLGTYYTSIMCPEVNFSSYPVKELLRLGYKRFYRRENYDSAMTDIQDKYGFRTTARSRNQILIELIEFMRTEIDKINDYDTLNEALTFVYLDGKMQASEGSHDDLIMALAIALEAIKQIPAKRKVKAKEDQRFTDDYQEKHKKNYDNFWG